MHRLLNRSGLENLYLTSFILLIASLPFSYQPYLHLASHGGANFDLTIIYVFMGLFVIVSLPKVWHVRNELASRPCNLALVLFVAWNILSVLWSENTTRGLASSLLITMLSAVALSTQAHIDLFIEQKKALYITLSTTTVVLFLFCLWQLIGDAIGAPPSVTLLPHDYRYYIFGFARVTGFSAEPEFLGNLLLIPLSVFIYGATVTKRRTYLYLTFITIVTIMLTLSRGALIGTMALLVTSLLFNYKKYSFKYTALTFSTLLLGVVVSFCLFALAPELNTRSSATSSSSLTKAVGQLSLGRINLNLLQKQDSNNAPKPPSDGTTDASVQPNVVSLSPTESSIVSSGYVAASTHSRISMSVEAITLLKDRPSRFVHGVGIGSFGTTLHKKDASFSQSSIVNNQYIELLTETGIIGLVLFLSFIITAITKMSRRSKRVFAPAIIGILFQWLFFSGYPNILHLWPLLGIAIAYPDSRNP